jgi:hypothetical protein
LFCFKINNNFINNDGSITNKVDCGGDRKEEIKMNDDINNNNVF